MGNAQKFIALLRTAEKEYYIQYFRSSSRRDIATLRKAPDHMIMTVLKFNEKNQQKIKRMKVFFNQLNGF